MNPDLDWQRRYEQDDTPWDKGAPAPPLVDFLAENQIMGRVLVPGCGRGHEVRALGQQPRASVVGLDISAVAIAQARELAAQFGAGSGISFVEGDFFNLPPNLRNSFDWLVEHTCFCAIEPARRPEYVLAATEALRTGGQIFAIFYLNPDTECGPPFAASREEITELFDRDFILVDEWSPAESFPGREGREWVRIMRKR